MNRQCSMANNKIIKKLLIKLLIKQQILLIKTVTILSRVVYVKQQKSFYKHEQCALAYTFIWL